MLNRSSIHALVTIFLLVFAIPAHADLLIGRVVGIADGDTITILDSNKAQYKIRLAGIDTPEKGQPFGNRAKENLSSIVFGKSVSIEYEKRDRYGRIVGKVMVGNQDACLAQIKAGMAWHFKIYEAEQPLADRKTYAAAEIQAQKDHVGLWRDRDPTPPWEWRRIKRGDLKQPLPSFISQPEPDAFPSNARIEHPQ